MYFPKCLFFIYLYLFLFCDFEVAQIAVWKVFYCEKSLPYLPCPHIVSSSGNVLASEFENGKN